MYMTSPKLKNGSTVVRLVISFRHEGKVKNRIVKVIGQSKSPKLIRQYKKTAQNIIDQYKKGRLSFPQISEIHNIDLYRFLGASRYNYGFEDIFGASYEQLGFSGLIESGRSNKTLNKVLQAMVLMRVFYPSSKLSSCDLLEKYFDKIISHKQVLVMMDHLTNRLDSIREKIFHSILKEKPETEVLLFDVTTLYFESMNSTELQDFGYSKDGKFNETQVVLAVLASKEGLPLAYEVFPGNTGETKTMQVVLSQFIQKHEVKKVRVVADRAMFSNNNFQFFKDLKDKEGIKAEYVVACPLKKLPKEIKEKIFDFKRKQIARQMAGQVAGQGARQGARQPFESVACYKFEYQNRQIIVSYSEKLRSRDQNKRQKILDKLTELCQKHKNQVPAQKLVKNTGVRRYLKTLKGSVEIDQEKIVQDSLYDGLYGVCSNIETKSPQETINLYRSLWKIEELFRINKHTLKMRPIYHRLPRRIKAHILICFLAYAVLRRTEIVLKKAGLELSPQGLIDTLKDAEGFIIKDKLKGASLSYCIPMSLSETAKQIYAIFGKDYPKRPYKLENGH